MKFFKKENGFTLIDIIIALIVILIFMSLISILFFNITKSSKGIERESEATYIATNIIESFKAKKYDEVLVTNDFVNLNVGNNNEVYYNVETVSPTATVTLNLSNQIQDGYNCIVKVERYSPENETGDYDLVKKITVIVKYKLANELKEVELSTSIARQ